MYCNILTHIGIEDNVSVLEQQYVSLLENNPDAILIFDADSRLTFANSACERMFGYGQEELFTKTLIDSIDPVHRMRVLRHTAKVLHGIPQHDEAAVISKRGERIEIGIKLVPLIVDGESRGYFAIVFDITDRILAQRELQATKSLLESFINQSTDAIAVLGTDGKVRLVNPAFQELYGWRAEEVIGKELPTVPPEYAAELETILQTVRDGGQVTGLEAVRVKNDGTRMYTSLSVSPIRNEHGEVVAIAKVSRDITERKCVEAALSESEARYRSMAEHMRDVIGTMDTQGVITYAAPSSKTVLGYTPETYVGLSFFDCIHPQDAERARRQFHGMLETGEPCRVDFRYRHGDGHLGYMEVYMTPVVYESEVDKVVIVGREVTERKRTDELLRVSEKLAALGQLAAGVAHEIRNPMTALRGFMQLLKEKVNGYDDYFNIMLSELGRVDQIVSEFLMLSKPQVTKLSRHTIGSILTQVTSLLGPEANFRNVQILLESPLEGPDVSCDEGQLKQVFLNVMKNALEAMPNGGKLWVRAFKKEEHFVAIQIEDEGGGISEEHLRRIGEPFFTTKSDGTGLGLMVSHKIIEEHGGRLFISSELGQGTLVEVLLPMCPNEQEAYA